MRPPTRSGSTASPPVAPPLGDPNPLPFELGGVLGRGGMGEVRAAYDPRLGRDVAVKMVAPGDKSGAARLAREATVTARLEHPGIVPVYAAGRGADGRIWYAMRLLGGNTLADAIGAAPDLPARLRLVRHVLDAAAALAYAHGHGVLHRDMKPDNVLVGAFGETVVADWGLACTLEEGRCGEPGVGTPGYAAPEQAAGQPIDPRADVYGLGTTLREVLGGARPPPGMPRELLAIAARATAPVPADRYPDAASLNADLLAWFEGRRVTAHEYTTTELIARLLQRWRLPLAVAAVGLLAVGLAVAVGALREAAARRDAAASDLLAVEARRRETRAFAAALRAQAGIAVEAGLEMDATILAANAVLGADTPEARGLLAAVYRRPPWSPLGVMPVPPCTRRALSPGGSSLLCFRDQAVSVLDLATGKSTVSEGPWTRGTFAGHDDAVVLFDEIGLLYSWRVGDEPVPLGLQGSRSGNFPASGTPFRAVLPTTTGAAYVDVAAGAVAQIDACAPTRVEAAGLDEVDHVVAACTDHRVLRVGPGKRSARVATLPADVGLASLVQPAPGGWLFVGTVTGHALWLRPAGTVAQRARLGEDAVATASILGERAAVGLSGGDLVPWDLASGTVQTRFRGEGILSAWLDVSRLRVVGAQVVDRAAPASTQPHRLDLGHGVSALAFSADGGTLAVAGGDGLAVLIDTASGRQVRLDAGADVVKDVTFSPLGDELLLASAGLRQRVVRLADQTTRDLASGESWRRGGWLARLGPVGAPYRREVVFVAGPPAVEGDSPPGLSDIEGVVGGARLAAVDGSDSAWLLRDGPVVYWKHLGTFPAVSAVASSITDTFLVGPTGLSRVDDAGRATWTTPVPLGALDAAVTPDGALAAVSMMDGTTYVYRVGASSPSARLAGHRARVAAVTFSPDGRWLATGGWDNEVRLWSMDALDADAAAAAATAERQWGRGLDDVLGTVAAVEPR